MEEKRHFKEPCLVIPSENFILSLIISSEFAFITLLAACSKSMRKTSGINTLAGPTFETMVEYSSKILSHSSESHSQWKYLSCSSMYLKWVAFTTLKSEEMIALLTTVSHSLRLYWSHCKETNFFTMSWSTWTFRVLKLSMKYFIFFLSFGNGMWTCAPNLDRNPSSIAWGLKYDFFYLLSCSVLSDNYFIFIYTCLLNIQQSHPEQSFATPQILWGKLILLVCLCHPTLIALCLRATGHIHQL